MFQQRMVTLRQEMAVLGLKGLLVTLEDRFLSKSVPAHDNWVRHLTGFEGSAAQVLLIAEDCFLLTDARYAAEAAKQLNPDGIRVFDTQDKKLSVLLQEQIMGGGNLGVCFWRISAGFFLTLQKSVPSVVLVDFPEEIVRIFTLWGQDDAAKAKKQLGHAYTIDTTAMAQIRLESARSLFKDETIFFQGRPDAISWLLGLRAEGIPFVPLLPSYGLLTKDMLYIWCDVERVPPDVQKSCGPGISFYPLQSINDMLPNLLGGRTFSCDADKTPHALVANLKAQGVDVTFQPDPMLELQAQKSADDKIALEAAQLKEAVAFSHLWFQVTQAIQRGERLSEWDVVQRLETIRKRDAHYKGPSFPTIAGFGPNSALIHYRPTPEKNLILSKESVLLVDAGGHYLPAATTDTTRVFYLGTTPSDDVKGIYTRLLKGFIAYASLVFPEGVPGCALESAARKPLWEVAADYPHATGHGVGTFLNVHEYPTLSTRSMATLKPGNSITLEPGYYKTGAFGMRLEDRLWVHRADAAGFLNFEDITFIPFDPLLVDQVLLTMAEKEWLRTYHQAIADKLLPLLDGTDVQSWIQEKIQAFLS